MKVNLDFVKYAKVAEKGISKLFSRVATVVQNKPKLLKGINLAQSKIKVLSEDVFTFLNKAQKPDGFITKAQKYIEKFLTNAEQRINEFRAKDLKLDFKTVKA